jgi:N-methylhydantoinase B
MSKENSSMENGSMDAVTLEILRSTFRAICTEGGALLDRIAYSPTISEGKDRTVTLHTPDARMISHGELDMCPHLGSSEESLRAVKQDIDDMQNGDVYIFNDPHRGGTHVNDVKFYRPIFVDGEIFAFVMTLAHWSDMGGPYPGSFNPRATECYAEGLKLPALRIFKNEQPVKFVFDLLKNNIRAFPDRYGEIYGQYQGGLLIEKRLKETIEKYGKETVRKSFEETMNYSERLFRAGLRQIPDGEYEFEDYGDKDVGKPNEPKIKVHCKITKKQDEVTLDYTESDPAPVAAWGFSRTGLLSATYAATMHYFPELNPLNNGVIRRLKILSKPGTCVDVLEPAPISGYCSGAYEKVLGSAMGCWARAFASTKPERVNAFAENLLNIVTGGIHPKKRREYVSYIWVEGGLGARSYKDGPSYLQGFYIGKARNQPVEVHERWYPMVYTDVEIVQDSCGDGKFRGGFGLQRNFTVTADTVISEHGDREDVTPYGLAGGTNGGPAKLILNKGKKGEKNLGVFVAGFQAKAGDHLTFYSNGGGGYGNPLERDPKLVLEDVIDGYISLEKARITYGVAIKILDQDTLQYVINEEATNKLRSGLAGKELKRGYGPGEVNPWGEKIKAAEKVVLAQ